MHIGKFRFDLRTPVVRFYQFLSKIWFVPFGFYPDAVKENGKIPHPMRPRCWRDLILNKMMIPDTTLRAIVADKISARGWAAEKIGEKYIAQIYDICETVEQLSARDYPFPYVVKTNHASGQYHLVNNESDRAEMLIAAAKWDMGTYKPRTEWAYRDIPSRFIVEKMLVRESQTGTLEYKVYCFFGEPILIRIWAVGKDKLQKVFVTADWEKIDVALSKTSTDLFPEEPNEFKEVKRLASILSAEFDFIRVDFMALEGKIFFGEMTNFPTGGRMQFSPPEFDAFLMSEYNRLRKERIAELRKMYANLSTAEMADKSLRLTVGPK